MKVSAVEEEAWLTAGGGVVLVDGFQGVCGSAWEVPRPKHMDVETSCEEDVVK